MVCYYGYPYAISVGVALFLLFGIKTSSYNDVKWIQIDEIYYFSYKKCSYTCVCAFFVVPLQAFS